MFPAASFEPRAERPPTSAGARSTHAGRLPRCSSPRASRQSFGANRREMGPRRPRAAKSLSPTSKRARAGGGTTALALAAAPASLCLCHEGNPPKPTRHAKAEASHWLDRGRSGLLLPGGGPPRRREARGCRAPLPGRGRRARSHGAASRRAGSPRLSPDRGRMRRRESASISQDRPQPPRARATLRSPTQSGVACSSEGKRDRPDRRRWTVIPGREARRAALL
jgi:hypothetical protein